MRSEERQRLPRDHRQRLTMPSLSLGVLCLWCIVFLRAPPLWCSLSFVSLSFLLVIVKNNCGCCSLFSIESKKIFLFFFASLVLFCFLWYSVCVIDEGRSANFAGLFIWQRITTFGQLFCFACRLLMKIEIGMLLIVSF